MNGVWVKDMVGDGVTACVGAGVDVDVIVVVEIGLEGAQLVIMNPIRTMIVLKFTDIPLKLKNIGARQNPSGFGRCFVPPCPYNDTTGNRYFMNVPFLSSFNVS